MINNLDRRIDIVRDHLTHHNQQHVLQFADQLDQTQLKQLITEIENLDLVLIDELIRRFIVEPAGESLPEQILPPPVYPVEPPAGLSAKYQQALDLGRRLIADGKVAAFTVAGGMGTRLNFDGPKGLFPATPLKRKTLFQIFAETIRATQKRHHGQIPWYIMTSSANHQTTVQAFKDNNYYQLDPDNLIFFRQGQMPALDSQGKILLGEPHRLALSPEGHGGSLRALFKSGALDDMNRRQIEFISYFQVDNPLVKVVDPLFIGLHALDQAEMSSKALIKTEPLEKVGNFVLADGKIQVIEYSDLPEELAFQKNDDGELTFNLGSPAIHVISRNFVQRLNEHGFSLPWHLARKRVPFVDQNGQIVDPTEPNAIKMETFVFDALPLAEKSIILAIERVEEFAPIKNATGVDSLESSLRLQTERAAQWLQKTGVDIPRSSDGAVDACLEISPLWALDAEELIQKKPLLPIKPGLTYYFE